VHVFLSYSREDTAEAHKLSAELESRGIPSWIDSSGLPPGTPQWDREIRQALDDSCVVIAVCSEHARESPFVAIELEIAKGNRKPILPVWISGDVWVNSCPVSLALSQHIDLRTPDIFDALDRLSKSVLSHASAIDGTDTSTGWPLAHIEWKNSAETFNTATFSNRGMFLSDLYIKMLQDDFEPFTYGKDWALDISGNRLSFGYWSCPVFALPCKWADQPMTPVHELEPNWVFKEGPSEFNSATEIDINSQKQLHQLHAGRRFRVVDLRDLETDIAQLSSFVRGIRKWDGADLRSNFIGIKCGYHVLSAFTAARHPKELTMRLYQLVESAKPKLRGSIERTEPRYEFVTIQDSYNARFLLPRMSQPDSRVSLMSF
jgi:hypothetical protein